MRCHSGCPHTSLRTRPQTPMTPLYQSNIKSRNGEHAKKSQSSDGGYDIKHVRVRIAGARLHAANSDTGHAAQMVQRPGRGGGCRVKRASSLIMEAVARRSARPPPVRESACAGCAEPPPANQACISGTPGMVASSTRIMLEPTVLRFLPLNSPMRAPACALLSDARTAQCVPGWRFVGL